jgi:hypothetical protein
MKLAGKMMTLPGTSPRAWGSYHFPGQRETKNWKLRKDPNLKHREHREKTENIEK